MKNVSKGFKVLLETKEESVDLRAVEQKSPKFKETGKKEKAKKNT